MATGPSVQLGVDTIRGLRGVIGTLLSRLDQEAAALDVQRKRLDAARAQMQTIADHLDSRLQAQQSASATTTRTVAKTGGIPARAKGRRRVTPVK
jgi:hypothetical protein